MKNIFRTLFFAGEPVTEYSTVTIPGGIRETVFLETADWSIDVSARHWLLCLKPVTYGIWMDKAETPRLLPNVKAYTLCFREPGLNGSPDTVAVVALGLFDRIPEESGSLLLFRYAGSRVFHTAPFKNLLLYRRYYRKPGFSFDQLKSFASAYSYPRKVRLVSFRDNEGYNIFPMDLLGMIPGGNRCVFGLRHTNVTLPKILSSGKLVASEIAHVYKEIIYKLGSHHSSAAPLPEQLPFKVKTSERFGFFIPEWADAYREIHIRKNIDLGSHMLLWGEWENHAELQASSGNLFHIHFLLRLRQLANGNPYPLV